MTAPLSARIRDEIDGGEECRGRDAMLTEWATEAQALRDALAMLVNVMRACDPEYCAAHDWEPCDDQRWDDALAEAEDLLDAAASADL